MYGLGFFVAFLGVLVFFGFLGGFLSVFGGVFSCFRFFCFVFFVVVAFCCFFFKFFTIWLLVGLLLDIEVFILMSINSGNMPGSNSQLF